MYIFKQDDGTYVVYNAKPDGFLTEQEYQKVLEDQAKAERVRQLTKELYDLGYSVAPITAAPTVATPVATETVTSEEQRPVKRW